jgi:hypothetical protein
MNRPNQGPEDPQPRDPDADPKMMTSGAEQPSQAEGDDDDAETP